MPENSILNFTVIDIDGHEVQLRQYAGSVLLIVNVASKCGFTAQYSELQQLYEMYHKQGFEVLGFPSNDFLWQEPGSNAEIKQFCTLRYNVTFPVFGKISVKGKEIAPLYEFLTSTRTNPQFGGKISWNFNKFLVDRAGRVVNRFGTRTAPLAEDVIKAIESALTGES